MGRPRFQYSGLLIAVIGFVLTRFTVTLALDDPIRFYVAGVVPLLLGLGLAAFGVALVVADVDEALVRTTALWCVIGTATMLVLVVLTVVGSAGESMPPVETIRSRIYLSNFLIGGSIGGTFTGLYAARTRRQRTELQHQANRLEALNRLLRHEVLNAVSVISGYSDQDGGASPDDLDVIHRQSTGIAETIEEVRYLTRRTTHDARDDTTDLAASLRAAIETVREQHPAASIVVDDLPEGLSVQANERVRRVFVHLLDNAVVHTAAETPTVRIGITETATSVRISVSDDGPGLPPAQRALLETGEITEYDDPREGYGLNVVRLLVETFGGAIETEVSDSGSTVTVTLSRADPRERDVTASATGLFGLRLDVPHLAVTLCAALLAGLVYGLLSERLGGSVAAIGVFYGISDPVVGWITHEFHSAVFGFIYAGLVSQVPARYRDHLPAFVGIGIGWALVLWAGAAGVIAPLWLQLLGFSVPIPNLSRVLLATHLAWGVTLGLLTCLGYRHVSPWVRGLHPSLERGATSH